MKFIPSTWRFRAAAVFACYLLSAGVVGLAGQPPEEEEAPKSKTKKKIVVEDPDPPSGVKSPGGNSPDKRLDELDGAAAAAKNPAVKKLLASYAVPFDRIVEKGETLRIVPIPKHWKKDTFPANSEFPVIPIDGSGKALPARKVSVAKVKSIEPFEQVVQAEVDSWLKQRPVGTGAGPADLSADDQLAAAEKLLAAANRYHDTARETGVRKGKSWDDIHQPLHDRWRDVALEQLTRAVDIADWQRARMHGTRLMIAFPKDPLVAKKVAIARVSEAALLMKSNDQAQRVQARELLDEFESRFPGGGDDAIRAIRKQLTDEASRLYDRALAHKKAGNAVEARNELDRAEALDPTLPGLRDLKRDIGSGSPVLYVGVREFPELMSPATARFDSEHYAVELLFDGLLDEVPDKSGGTRYRTGAALGFPLMIPGGRELHLRQTPRSANGMEGFEAHDVVETIKMLRSKPALGVSASLPWLGGLPIPTGSGSLRFAFTHGHPDPRSLLTFKILPGRYLTEKGKKLDDQEFAARPFGTGPYRIYALPEVGGSGPRELIFVDNSAYGRAKDRTGQPHINEIRFVETAKLLDPFDDFRRGRLHLLPDLSPKEVEKALAEGGSALGGKGKVVTAATNRRVHVLAVNHNRTHLQNLDLRKGICSAIDRDEIVNELFRVANPQHNRFTEAMSGPYPPKSWAAVRAPGGAAVPLVNRADAAVRLKRYLDITGVQNEIKLAYSTGDPKGLEVCERIKNQVETLTEKKLVLKLEGLEPRNFHRQIFGEHRYDLAYVPIDYPDDWHPFGLASMLDPGAAVPGGRNFSEFLGSGTNPTVEERDLNAELAGLIQHRDFNGDIRPRAARIHRLFNDCVPFIPLWQLDRHMLISSRLKVFVDDSEEAAPVQLLNPSILFQNVGRWRLD